jgi:hypothetical protein
MHDSPQNCGSSPHVTFVPVDSTLGFYWTSGEGGGMTVRRGMVKIVLGAVVLALSGIAVVTIDTPKGLASSSSMAPLPDPGTDLSRPRHSEERSRRVGDGWLAHHPWCDKRGAVDVPVQRTVPRHAGGAARAHFVPCIGSREARRVRNDARQSDGAPAKSEGAGRGDRNRRGGEREYAGKVIREFCPRPDSVVNKI